MPSQPVPIRPQSRARSGSPPPRSSRDAALPPPASLSARFYRSPGSLGSTGQVPASLRYNVPVPPQFSRLGELSNGASPEPLQGETPPPPASGGAGSLVDAVGSYLVQRPGDAESVASPAPRETLGSVSHQLPGGSITHDVYQWATGGASGGMHRRTLSDPSDRVSESLDAWEPSGTNTTQNSGEGLLARRLRSGTAGSGASVSLETPWPSVARDRLLLKQPGGFRRHHMQQQARQRGARLPGWLTGNFIEFLALYGHFAGGLYPATDPDEPDSESVADVAFEGDVGGVVGIGERSRERSRSSSSASPVTDDADDSAAELEPPDETELFFGVPNSPETVQSGGSSGGTSNSKTFFLLLKSFIGTGVLFLPKAFSNGGLAFSGVIMVSIGYLTLHCMLLLVKCERRLGGSYGDLAERLYGRWLREIVTVSIAVSQMGFACAYFIFVAQNMQALTAYFSGCRLVPSEQACVALQAVLYIPLSWVRQIKHFSLSSLVADVFIVIGLAYVLGFDFMQLHESGIAPSVVMLNHSKFPLFVGTAIFAYEGIGLMLPISQAMKSPETFPWILSVTLLLLGALMMVVGSAGYLAYGATVETIAFLNLPKTPATHIVQLLYALAIVCSFPLTIYPALRITEGYLFRGSGKSSAAVRWSKNGYRTLVVVALAALAIAGSSSLDKFVSLIGSAACIPLSFIFPALLHARLQRLGPGGVASPDRSGSYQLIDAQQPRPRSSSSSSIAAPHSHYVSLGGASAAFTASTRVVILKDYALAVLGSIALVYSMVVTIVRWTEDGSDQRPALCT